jgi:hypothetical protein
MITLGARATVVQLRCIRTCIAQEGRRAMGNYTSYHNIMRQLLRGMHYISCLTQAHG